VGVIVGVGDSGEFLREHAAGTTEMQNAMASNSSRKRPFTLLP
jgi:hypothetical protein